MEPHNKLSNRELFNIGVRLVKFAWVVEILAVSIGFLISIIVSFSVYTQLDKTDRTLNFGDYSSILVAALPFVLVAVVEAAKIPVATAMMYAKHRSWRLLFFVGLIMLATITFETMLNGFERNFSGLNIIIDDRKNEALLLQDKIDVLNRRKEEINIIHPQQVDENYQTSIRKANDAYYSTLSREREHVNSQIAKLGSEDSVTQQYQAEITALNQKEREIYNTWDKEREVLQQRLRGLLNSYVSGSEEDKAKLQKELDQLKAEMKQKMDDANFFTRSQVESKYRRLIAEKEDRLYTVSDRTIGDDALAKQTQSEQQLQDQLQVLGRDYQKRIDLGRERMAYLEEQILSQTQDIEQKRSAYQNNYARVLQLAGQNRNSTTARAAQEKDKQLAQYDEIQVEVKAIDNDIYDIQQQQSLIKHDINRLVNSNQIYRLAAYISDKEQAIEVPKSMVGLVALIWFASLAFISAVTGVFLAIAGIYMQRIYAKDDDYNVVPKSEEPTQP
ncbi:hypothetical protein GCM10009112_33630 [Marinomonas arenicola]|uniref:hypothetical protein n=1 Tax=Marinomonas TaxID=28253 RepID=UPI00105415B2|nr:hypothetical protein [Marinomonas sp. KMM3893]